MKKRRKKKRCQKSWEWGKSRDGGIGVAGRRRLVDIRRSDVCRRALSSPLPLCTGCNILRYLLEGGEVCSHAHAQPHPLNSIPSCQRLSYSVLRGGQDHHRVDLFFLKRGIFPWSVAWWWSTYATAIPRPTRSWAATSTTILTHAVEFGFDKKEI